MSKKFEGYVSPQGHIEKVEQPMEAQEEKAEAQTPEQIAQGIASAYWSKRLEDNQSSIENSNIRVQGGDFDSVRCQAYF